MDALKILLNRRPITAPKAMPLKLNLEAMRHLESSLLNNERVAESLQVNPDEIQDLISRPLAFLRAPL